MKNHALSKWDRVKAIFDLYRNFGHHDYIGEPVSQIEHMCQAATLAEQKGYGEDVILAAFFHDIGHLLEANQQVKKMGEYGVADHEKIGGNYLRGLGFPEKIAKLVENHVQAKRYLTYKYPEYYEKLSEASKNTLVYQGGVMAKEEAEAFEKEETFELSLLLREWDELAKEQGVETCDLGSYEQMALRVID